MMAGMQWMDLLVIVHVLSAIIGVGPTFYSHVLLRQNQTVEELRTSFKMMKPLELFPKIGGSLAVVTGLILVLTSDYGKFTQLWILGSLILYVLIQVIVIGMAAPNTKKVGDWLMNPANKNADTLPSEQEKAFAKANLFFYGASTLAIVLFIFMIIRPN
jgi:uncharacterized membrane protein